MTPRSLAYWCAGGSICGRGGIALTHDDSTFLLEVFDAELNAALAAGRGDIAREIVQRAFDLSHARIAHRRWVAAAGPIHNIMTGAA